MVLDTGSPFCSKVARAETSFTGAGLPSTVGEMDIFMSERAKLPFVARPGPPFTSVGSAIASSRRAVMFLTDVFATKVYISFSGSAPLTRYEPSICASNLTPSDAFADWGSKKYQDGWTAFDDLSPSHFSI